MHYAQLLKPRLLGEPLPPIQEGDTFEVLGYTFVVTQVIGETCYIKPAGASWDKACDRQQLQALLARIGTPVPGRVA